MSPQSDLHSEQKIFSKNNELCLDYVKGAQTMQLLTSALLVVDGVSVESHCNRLPSIFYCVLRKPKGMRKIINSVASAVKYILEQSLSQSLLVTNALIKA